MENKNRTKMENKEKIINLPNNGFPHFFLGIAMLISPITLAFIPEEEILDILTIPLAILGIFWLFGLFVVQPNQTRVLIFFGKYKGTVTKNGFFWLNPLYKKKKVSLRIRNLESNIIKVNDEQGNPILISSVIVWRIKDTYKAVFNIETQKDIDKTGVSLSKPEESYRDFIKIQAESALRKLAHSYPYDDIECEHEHITLRSGENIINEELATELKERLDLVGIEVLESKISNLSYAPEIASAMLQRQQAQAIITARTRIVEGAVSMVEMAISQLEERNITKFTAEEKAKMVNNLMVVLSGHQGTSPVINIE